MEFPIGNKLFHLVVSPGMSRCPTVDLELVQTTRNVNGTRHSVQKFQPGNGPTVLDFSLFLRIFQWDEPTKRVPFTAELEILEILTKWKAPKESYPVCNHLTQVPTTCSQEKCQTYFLIHSTRESLSCFPP